MLVPMKARSTAESQELKLRASTALYVSELKDLYSAENEIARSVAKLAKAASTLYLRQFITDHSHQIQVHVARLEQVIERLGVGPKGNECKVVEMLTAQQKDLIREATHPEIRDAILIAVQQQFVHFVMAGYRFASVFARRLGYGAAADVLGEILKEKIDLDTNLTELSRIALSGCISNPSDAESTAAIRPLSSKPFSG